MSLDLPNHPKPKIERVLRSFEIVGQLPEKELVGVFRQREFETMAQTIKRGKAILKLRSRGRRVRWLVTDVTVY